MATSITRVPYAEIVRRYGPGEGRHWFDKDTIRFFQSRISDGYEGLGGLFFVSSEKNHGYGDHQRAYTVRQLTADRDIKTIGEFNKLSRSEAHSLARFYARHGIKEEATV